MSCSIGCPQSYGSPSPSRCCDCWIPFDKTARNTADLIDRTKKFGTVAASADAAFNAADDGVRFVIGIAPVAKIVMDYLTIDRYEIYDLIDALDQNGSVYSAVILDRWLIDGDPSDWYLVRYLKCGAYYDLIVRRDALNPFSQTDIRIGPKSYVLRFDKAERSDYDPRWPTLDRLPFRAIMPFRFPDHVQTTAWSVFESGAHRSAASETAWLKPNLSS